MGSPGSDASRVRREASEAGQAVSEPVLPEVLEMTGVLVLFTICDGQTPTA
ncbi:hypothetical protein ABZZ20_33375 [Streptomyces sp. NPDC006430]|uniref:hypothetical protein n=1 Tax=Streptomyces sp. NPDC006430 TaxID=3154299 RepID=UPI0033B0FFCF